MDNQNLKSPIITLNTTREKKVVKIEDQNLQHLKKEEMSALSGHILLALFVAGKEVGIMVVVPKNHLNMIIRETKSLWRK